MQRVALCLSKPFLVDALTVNGPELLGDITVFRTPTVACRGPQRCPGRRCIATS
jgi:hypothetical protein